MSFLVSIHDVAPPFLPQVEELWACCREFDVVPDLLVVRCWHGTKPIDASPATLAWVHARVADGAAALLHGERHDEVGTHRTLRDWWAAVGRTASEGEFLTLDEPGAGARIRRGVARLRRVGIDPVGFVAPAWLARPATRRAAAAAGLRLTEDVGGIWLLSRPRHLRAPVIRWSARTPLRAALSGAVAAVRRHGRSPLVRVALHPGDVRSTTTRRSILDVLSCLRERHEPIGYATLLQPEDRVCAT